MDRDAVVLAQLISKSNAVLSLDISGNMFSERGAIAIARALENNNTVRRLSFAVCPIGDEGKEASPR